jgi:hypothetical protein
MNILGVVLFMYKKPTAAAKLTESDGFIGIGEFLLVSYCYLGQINVLTILLY